jgi:hypothetical protein
MEGGVAYHSCSAFDEQYRVEATPNIRMKDTDLDDAS